MRISTPALQTVYDRMFYAHNRTGCKIRTGSASYTVNVARASITVKANDISIVFGDAEPPLTPVVTGMKNGDNENLIAYTLSRTEGTTVGTYTVIWLNEDGSVLKTDENIPHSTVPNYDGAAPKKASTAEYEYIYTGWSPSEAAVTGNGKLFPARKSTRFTDM